MHWDDRYIMHIILWEDWDLDVLHVSLAFNSWTIFPSCNLNSGFMIAKATLYNEPSFQLNFE